MVLKKRLKKLLIIALVAITIVCFVALYLHIQDYNRYLQDKYASYIERFGESGGQWLWDSSQEVPTIVRFFRFLGYAWPNGFFLIQSALIIFLAWIFVIISTLRHMLKINKHNDN